MAKGNQSCMARKLKGQHYRTEAAQRRGFGKAARECARESHRRRR